MKPLFHLAIFSIVLISCSKMGLRRNTEYSCSAEDITTGVTSIPVKVQLIEIETPNIPFSPLNEVVIEEFEMSFGETVSSTFKAQEDSRYSYELRFDGSGGQYNSTLVTDDPAYFMVDRCPLLKKGDNNCSLRIEPTGMLSVDLTNTAENGASNSDRIEVIITDGNVVWPIDFKGLGSGISDGLKLPHGYYTMHYQVYSEDNLVSEVDEAFYLKHNADTTIQIDF